MLSEKQTNQIEPFEEGKGNTSKDVVTFKEFVDKCQKVFYFLIRRIKKILIMGVMLGLLWAIYAFFSPTEYIAELTFGINHNKKSSKLGGYLDLAENMGIDIGSQGLSSPNDNLLSPQNLPVLLESKKLVYNVFNKRVYNPLLRDSIYVFDMWLDTYLPKQQVDVKQLFYDNLYTPLGESKERDSIFLDIYESIIEDKGFINFGTTQPKSSIYELKVSTKSEYLSYCLARQLLSEIMDIYIDIYTKNITEQIAFLESQIDGMSKEYTERIKGTPSPYMQNINKSIYNTDPEIATKNEELKIQREIYFSTLSKLQALTLEKKKEMPIFFILDDTILPLKEEKKSVLKFTFIGFILGCLGTSFVLLAIKYLKMNYNQQPH